MSFRLPTKGNSTGDVLPQNLGLPYHSYSRIFSLRITLLISAPKDSISTFRQSFSKKYLIFYLLCY